MPHPSPSGRKRHLPLALAAASLLAAIAAGAFWYATGVARKAPPKATDNTVTVAIRDKVCHPADITVAAGRTTFTIVNQSDRALEWEILDGVMVVEERENIAPGFSQTMTVNLHPGEYDITCGLLSSPRGKLHVTPSDASVADAARPATVQYVGALAEYRVWLMLQADVFDMAVRALYGAIRSGDLHHAQALYGPAHAAYLRIGIMGDLFADLDQRINARAELFERRADDPAFRGFYRLEHGLFALGSIDGLAPIADRLVEDATLLATRLQNLTIPPAQLAPAAAKMLRREAGYFRTAASAPIGIRNGNGDSPGNDQFNDGVEHRRDAIAGTALQGTLDGARKIATLLAPLLKRTAPELQREIAGHFAACDAFFALRKHSPAAGGNTGSRTKTSAIANAGIDADIDAEVIALADAMQRINATLGLE